MFGISGSKSCRDPQIGEFARTRGYWRGTISLDDGTKPALILSGGRAEPDAEALVNA